MSKHKKTAFTHTQTNSNFLKIYKLQEIWQESTTHTYPAAAQIKIGDRVDLNPLKNKLRS